MNSKLLPLAAVLLLVGAFMAGTNGKGNLRTQLRAAQNERALSDSLKVVWSGEAGTLSERLAVIQDSEKELQAIMDRTVPAMARRIASLEGKAHALIEAQATIDSIMAVGTAVDTVIIMPDSTEVHQVTFTHSQPGIRIDVMTRTPPPTFELQASFDPINLDIGIFELPTGEVGVDVQTPEWVTLGKLNTNIDLPGPTWWERSRWWICSVSALIIWEWFIRPND